MADNKQVMDLQANKDGVSKAESNEQQRNWNDKFWEKKASDSLSNYDPTRKHLNFEVTKGGHVQPIDISKSIAEKMKESLDSRGIKNPNERQYLRRKQRILAQFVFGGSRDRMLEIAFGKQHVNLDKGADNSHLTRNADIENWAKDIYNFVAKRFGEENIVSFYVHLDELNPHVHCVVLPVDDVTNRISWTSKFGKNPAEEGHALTILHDELEAEVNKKWGLERGSNMEETKAKHRSTEEYKRDLIKTVEELADTVDGLREQIRTLTRKVKSFTTMIENLQARKEDIRQQIDLIASQFGDGEKDDAKLAKKIADLRYKLDGINEKIDIRQQMLDETTEQLENARIKLASMMRQHDNLGDIVRDKNDLVATRAERDVARAYNSAVAASLDPLLHKLTPEQKELLDSTGFTELMENGQNIMNCAMLLALNYISQATTYAESCGGGGGSTAGWGRSKDDDDELWWLKCVTKATEMTSPIGGKKTRKR